MEIRKDIVLTGILFVFSTFGLTGFLRETPPSVMPGDLLLLSRSLLRGILPERDLKNNYIK